MSLSTGVPRGQDAEANASLMPTITVVIPTRNRGNLIAETIQTLCSLDYPGLTILVIDQSIDTGTCEAVRTASGGDPRIFWHSTKTIGSSAARNIGAALSKTDVVAYTDDDCIVSADWLTAIAAQFQDSETVAVYGRLIPYEIAERTGHEVGFKPSADRQVYTKRTPPWYIGHGGNMAFRRTALLTAGGFDPLLGAGCRFGACEDPDIAYRLLASGQKIIYCPAALVYHKHWKDWIAQKKMERAYGIGAGAMFAKYIRSGDRYGWRLLATWIWELGVRRTFAGLLKWRSRKTMYLGYCQLVYPWMGIWQARKSPINTDTLIYADTPRHAPVLGSYSALSSSCSDPACQ